MLACPFFGISLKVVVCVMKEFSNQDQRLSAIPQQAQRKGKEEAERLQ